MAQVASHFFKQTFRIPKPTFTEADLPSQSGRVVIVTGGYAGVGFELAQILYGKHATIYIAGRSNDKAQSAIKRLQEAHPSSKGRVCFLKLDLADLKTVHFAVEEFLSKERSLDVLVNNAGVMFPPIGSVSVQGHELQMATNCLGHFLLAQLLWPVLERTAATAEPGTVRIAWAASFGVDALSPPGGVSFDNKGDQQIHKTSSSTNYGATKAGNLFLASKFASRHPVSATDGKGVLNIAFNPGHLRTELQRHSSGVGSTLVDKLLLNPPVYGAYTELWCGWSPEVKPQHNGAYAWPWGRFGPVRKDVQVELDKPSGKAEMFWKWCEKETKQYVHG